MRVVDPNQVPGTRGRARSVRVAIIADPTQPLPLFAGADEQPAIAGATLAVHRLALREIVPALALLAEVDVLIVEIDPGIGWQIEQFGRIAVEVGKSLPLIAASRTLDSKNARALRRLGAIELISIPIDPTEFAEALAAAQRAIVSRRSVVVRGRTIALLGTVGGAGCTMLATQFGCALAALRSVCLLDLNIQAATAALYLDLKPPLGLLDLIEARNRLDAALLKSVAARHASGLAVIGGPPELVPLDTLTPSIVGHILRLARESFEVVLLDLPPAWTDWTLAALTASDFICLVTPLTVPGVRQARRQLDMLEANGLGARTRVLINRMPNRLFRTVDLGETEVLLRRKVDFRVSNDYPTVSAAIDQGRVLGSIKRGSRLVREINGVVQQLIAELDAKVVQ
jgi:pilus assembly protein CpaE